MIEVSDSINLSSALFWHPNDSLARSGFSPNRRGHGLVVMTSASHAEGPEFNPRCPYWRNYLRRIWFKLFLDRNLCYLTILYTDGKSGKVITAWSSTWLKFPTVLICLLPYFDIWMTLWHRSGFSLNRRGHGLVVITFALHAEGPEFNPWCPYWQNYLRRIWFKLFLIEICAIWPLHRRKSGEVITAWSSTWLKFSRVLICLLPYFDIRMTLWLGAASHPTGAGMV